MKPVILITLHRKYNDFARSLAIVNERLHEFSVEPSIIIIWSTPEEDREYWFDVLAENYPAIECIILRPKLEFEGEMGATTYPESYNIWYGLSCIKQLYDDCYAIVQAGDIIPKPDAYGEIDRSMQAGENGVLYFWNNNCTAIAGFCTYFFAIKMNEKWWPPVSPKEEADGLEWQWAKQIHRIREYPGRESFGAVWLQSNRFDHHNIGPDDSFLPYRKPQQLGLFISGEDFTNQRFSGWYWLQSWGRRIRESFKYYLGRSNQIGQT